MSQCCTAQYSSFPTSPSPSRSLCCAITHSTFATLPIAQYPATAQLTKSLLVLNSPPTHCLSRYHSYVIQPDSECSRLNGPSLLRCDLPCRVLSKSCSPQGSRAPVSLPCPSLPQYVTGGTNVQYIYTPLYLRRSVQIKRNTYWHSRTSVAMCALAEESMSADNPACADTKPTHSCSYHGLIVALCLFVRCDGNI